MSHVLLAMGLSKEQAETAIRISLGTETSQADIDRFTTSWKELYTRTHALREAA